MNSDRRYKMGYYKFENVLSATEPKNIPELIRAMMVLCDTISRLDKHVIELEGAAEEYRKF